MTCEMLSHLRTTVAATSGVELTIQTLRDFMPPRAQRHIPEAKVSAPQNDEEMRSVFVRAYKGGK